jgi:hypothetical protein
MEQGIPLWKMGQLLSRSGLSEIPESEASNPEAQDYVMHYFGLDLYDDWAHGRLARNAKPVKSTR